MLIYVCPTCRAVNDLVNIVYASIDDPESRRLVAFLIEKYEPTLGASVLRYLQLHAPAKNRLSYSRARAILTELVTAIKDRQITYRGRDWQAPVADWMAAFEIIFNDHMTGKMQQYLPLKNNHYLWAILSNRANSHEAIREQAVEQARIAAPRASTNGPQSIDRLAQAALTQAVEPEAAQAKPVAADTEQAPKVQSRTVREMHEQRERNLARRSKHLQGTGEDSTRSNDE